ncbi:MAG: FecR domain-containing protein [Bacteriovorax sp.]|nr:FecR domain-containing protein [Bacteriovorax sp.]
MRHIICIALLIPTILFANTPSNTIAEVVKIRGEATQLSPGARLARVVILGDKFVEDTSILTGAKSFIKIKLIDNSEINLGPESKIVISEMKKNSVGIISLLKGRIRTEVEKDSAKPNSNKFFVKTRTAALGVRGTDFQTIYNPENKMTSLLTYRGEVAMAKVDETTYKNLEESKVLTVERDELTKVPEIKKAKIKQFDEIEELNKVLKSKGAVLVPSGQNAFSSDSLKKTSLPVKISPVQLEALYKNQDFQEKSVSNLNLQSATDAIFKPTLKVANQVAPAEGLYNEKTGDFAPKAGGFIDLNTGLYVAPTNDAKLDAKSGVYVASKIGDIDADTGQYIAPKGLILDAKKGFILAEGEGDSKVEKRPELLALRQDLNHSIAKDIVVGGLEEEAEKSFNINEKFIRDRVSFSLWTMNQNITANKNSNNASFLELNSSGSVRFQFEWQMATNNRFSPLVGIDYGIVKFKDQAIKGVTQASDKLLGLSYGIQYAATKNINFYSKLGLHQEHYLDQTASGNNAYTLRKVVLTRLSLGANAEFWRLKKWSMDGSAGGVFTFRKGINNLVIHEGAGVILELLPKYKLSEQKWLGLGIKIENQFQRVASSVGVNRQDRNTGGVELKYISDF